MARDDREEPPNKKSVGRRTVLGTTILAASGVLAIAAVGGTARLWQSGAGGDLAAGPAFDPWRDWDNGTAEGLPGIVGAAILAASPHNSQPWLFTITDNIIDLHADTARGLGALDPFGREMMLGLGCAVENMVIGAEALGFTSVLNLFPAGAASNHIARMTVFAGERKNRPEAKFISKRHTHRGPYLRDKRIPDAVLDRLYAQTKVTATRLIWLGADGAAGAAFAKGTLEATEALIADAEVKSASAKWLRHDLKTVNQTRDGISTSTAGLSPFMTRLSLMLPTSVVAEKQHDKWLQLTQETQLPTAPLFGLIAVPDARDRTALVEAGRLWQRLHLTGTQNSLAMQPLNQMMEMADRDQVLARSSAAAEALTEIAGYADTQVIFGFRLGYANNLAPLSPRRGVTQVLTSRSA